MVFFIKLLTITDDNKVFKKINILILEQFKIVFCDNGEKKLVWSPGFYWFQLQICH